MSIQETTGNNEPERYRFGEFELDVRDRQLWQGQQRLDLNTRYLDALILLVRDPDRLIAKERFFDEVWEDVVVSDSALSQCIKELRKLLQDDASRPQYIQTVPRHGYRFVGTVERVGAHAASTAPRSREQLPRQEPTSDPAPAVPPLAERPAWQEGAHVWLTGSLGGAAAGLFGGMLYGFGLSSPAEGIGTLSTLLVLVVMNVLVGLTGAIGIAGGLALPRLLTVHGRSRIILLLCAATFGGWFIGGMVKMLGVDASNLLFGRAPAGITGGPEGAALGFALAGGMLLASKIRRTRDVWPRWHAAIGATAGTTLAGALIPLAGGHLMGGSLQLLAASFTESRLQLDGFAPLFGQLDFGTTTQAILGGLEGLLFGAGVSIALTLAGYWPSSQSTASGTSSSGWVPVIMMLVLVGTGCQQAAPPSDIPSRPNLLIIVTDDQRNDMLGLLHPLLETPTMDRMADKGVRFGNAFVTTPICAASRASMLTGLVETTHGYTFGTPPLSERYSRQSYPALLRGAGYHSGFIGKFGVRTELPPDSILFDVFEPLSPAPYMKPQEDGSERHLTDITADRALGYLDDRTSDQPFALTISFNAPHADDGDPRQYIWPPAMDSLYRDAVLPAPPLSDPAFFESLPTFLADSSLNRIRWYWRFDTEEKRQAMTKGYYRMISGVDAALGRIMARLEESGMADDTIVILMGDNGYFLGERGYAGKWLPLEPSIRVPLLVRLPGAQSPAGKVLDAPVLNIDLAPTLLDLAGLPVPGSMQGRSLKPFLLGSEPGEWRTDFLVEHRFDHPQIPQHEGVRSERYTYARYVDEEPVYEELYDRWEDPLQQYNLAGSTDHRDILDALRTRTDSLLARYAPD